MKPHLWLGLLGVFSLSVQAASLDVPINLVSADGAPKPVGNVTVSETQYGLLFTPNLKDLPAGIHGFHVHENGSCEAGTKDGKKVAALAAGGHFDPAKTGKHLGPYADGHLGDLPALYVNADGTANYPVLAPRLKKISEIKGHALMVHAGGDTKEILCAFGVDVDAVAGWLGSYGGEDSPDDISRGLFAGEVGAPRLLKLFERYGLRTTWFIPGHSMETFPEQMKAVADAGHEIGVHGYSHENPIAMTPEQEEIVLDKSIELITQMTGKRPTGYVAPWWEFSNVTNELLLKKGIKYDHSLMHNDFHPYYVRVGDKWTKIDYSQHPDTWMKPLVRGEETDLVEIPANWYLDDLPPMM